MLTGILAHEGVPLRPHDVAGAWNADPVLIGSLVLAAVLYHRGVRPGADSGGRRAAFGAGLAAVAVALLSPLDAMSGVLASAHMVQHVLLILVAAPLLALSAPGAALLRGAPAVVRRLARRTRRGVGLDAGRLRRSRSPVARWVAFVVTLWLWHAAALYGAAVEHEVVHAAEHLTFLLTALLVWSSILGPARSRVPRGLAVLGVFTLALQSVFLSALMTFARTPWYEPYLDSTAEWGLDPLADQQLAGVIMWIPAGFLHTGVGLALLVSWFRELDRSAGTTGSLVGPPVHRVAVDDDDPTAVGLEPAEGAQRPQPLHHGFP